MPKYDILEFFESCRTNQNAVIPFKQALDDADHYFGLKTKTALLDFIGNDGLEELEFINSKPWENNKDTTRVIWVDAYEFKSMCKLGYIAFMHNELTIKWLIKSFHLSENTSNAFAIALQKAGFRGGIR